MLVGTLGTVSRASGDTRPLAKLYQDMMDRAKELEQSGYDYLHLGEHHFTENQWDPSPLVVLSSIARETSVLRIGTNVLLTPLYHPIRLAEDVATVDLLSNGRVDLLCGSGSSQSEFEAYGIDVEQRAGRVWETMDILRTAYAKTEFSHNGKYFKIPNIRLNNSTSAEAVPIVVRRFRPQDASREQAKRATPCSTTLYTDWEGYLTALEANGHDPNKLNMGLCFVTMILVEKESDVEKARESVQARAVAQQNEYRDEREHGYQSVIEDAPPLADPNGPLVRPTKCSRLSNHCSRTADSLTSPPRRSEIKASSSRKSCQCSSHGGGLP